MARERDRRDAEGLPTLRRLPGEVQVDFGEADFRVRGVVTRGKYPTVTFPHSDVGLTQVFWGETAECACQGLRNVLEFVGGVPRGGGPRQRRRGWQARRRGGEGIGALPPLRGSPRARPRLRQPLLGQREGQRREQGRLPREEPIRPRPVVPRRPRVQPQAARGLPRPERGQAPLQARHARVRAVRGGRGAPPPLPPAAFSCARWEAGRRNEQGTVTVGGSRR